MMKDDTAGSGWWWGVSGVAGWHLRGARGCRDARRQQPCAHAACVRLVMYGISSSFSMCLIWNRSIRTWSPSRDEFCSFKKEKITKHCYVSCYASVWVWVWVFESATLIVSKQMSNCFLQFSHKSSEQSYHALMSMKTVKSYLLDQTQLTDFNSNETFSEHFLLAKHN